MQEKDKVQLHIKTKAKVTDGHFPHLGVRMGIQKYCNG